MAFYKYNWEVAPGTTRNKFNECSERVLNSGFSDFKASALTTGPHSLTIDLINIGRLKKISIEGI